MEERRETEMQDSASTPRRERPGVLALLPRIPAAVRAAVFVALGITLLTVAFDVGTASPGMCGSCHEMEPRAQSWGQSAHAVVSCVKCHQSPTAWYELPTRVADRARLLGRDVGAHLSGDFDDPVDGPVVGVEPMADEVCLQCHDPNRKATSGYRILIDHVEHAKLNGSCVSCHVRTAHPLKTRGTALSLMAQCYTCHGTAAKPTASAECATCHPADYDPRPQSHDDALWARGHGDTSQADMKQCTMCHESSFCIDCHGVEMPHPDDWAANHAEPATSGPEVCARCHEGGPDLCNMCHHTSYEPMQGTWIEQHQVEVEEEGSDFCLTCHEQAYCSFCHTKLVESDDPE